jgi:hypothetical protein
VILNQYANERRKRGDTGQYLTDAMATIGSMSSKCINLLKVKGIGVFGQ